MCQSVLVLPHLTQLPHSLIQSFMPALYVVVGLEWAAVVHVPQVKMVGDTKQPQLSLTESTIPRVYRHHNKAHAITSIKMSLLG